MDKKITLVVDKLNKCGFRTYSSCQGHGWPLSLPSFVAFRSSERQASCLSRVLRDDAESATPRLNWEWRIEGSFDADHRLVYRLVMTTPRRRIYRWLRLLLDRDLLALPNLVEIAVNNIQGSGSGKFPCCEKQRGGDDNHYE